MGRPFGLVAGGYISAMAPAAQRAFERALRETYDVEVRLVKALPGLARRASDEDLSKSFLAHAKVTEKHVDRLKKVFDAIDKQPRRRPYAPLDSLLDGMASSDGIEGDLSLIGTALVVEQLEQGLYRHLMKLADSLGVKRAVSQFEKSMGEEENAASELEGILQSIAG